MISPNSIMEDLSYDKFIELHKPQLSTSGVPEHLWHSLFEKVSREIFDAGNAFSLMLIDYSEEEEDESNVPFTICVSKPEGIKSSDADEIYLVDHAWTFQLSDVRQQLESVPSLADRMSAIIGIDLESPTRIAAIEKYMWKYCQAYSIFTEAATPEERVPIWYMMDEVGSAVNHSDEPNVRIVPFLYIPTSTTYSLLFPIEDCEEGEQVTRNYAENVTSTDVHRDAVLLPWKQVDLSNLSFEQKDPGEEYFLSGHIVETLPDRTTQTPKRNRDQPLKVYTDYDVIAEYLTDACFEVVDSVEEADVLWLMTHFKDFAHLAENTPNKFINQFPYEFVITIKDLLSVTCKRLCEFRSDPDSLETLPKWLPTTYNLKTELQQFVALYQNREKKHLDNHWIIKPWNLARSLDTHITDNLLKIVRLPCTGPKIAQKYLENPVLFYRNELSARVKFDVRYVILLKSVQPLEAYIHKKFFLRFSNKPFSMDSFEDYEKHFTVMNYTESADLKHIKCEDFVNMWHEQYPDNEWDAIENDICTMLHEMLECATTKPPPCGIGASPQSRALFAADIMIDWVDGKHMQPKLLEVNWMPDCKRACQYYPDFFNNIFQLLFLDEEDESSFRLITSNS